MEGLGLSLGFCTFQNYRSLISVSKLEAAGVDTVLGKVICKMVRGAMVLMRGFWCGTLYKLVGITYTNRCNSSIVPK